MNSESEHTEKDNLQQCHGKVIPSQYCVDGFTEMMGVTHLARILVIKTVQGASVTVLCMSLFVLLFLVEASNYLALTHY